MGVAEDDDVIRAAEAFAEVARALLQEREVGDTLRRIVDLAVEHLDGCEYAGISYVEGRRITSPASSNDIPRIVDRIQVEVDEGPCLDAIREHEVFRTGDLASEVRWPQFSKRAHDETGITSILSLRLFTEGDTMGALNLYSTAGDAFDDGAVALGAVFATHAAVAMRSAKREANLEHKADTRDLIGRAKGILMALQHVTDERAFELLVEASQRLNVKLVTVAEEVSETGQLPD
jgi:transcriptional regulator with GAF, ATPase, and Fis domain